MEHRFQKISFLKIALEMFIPFDFIISLTGVKSKKVTIF